MVGGVSGFVRESQVVPRSQIAIPGPRSQIVARSIDRSAIADRFASLCFFVRGGGGVNSIEAYAGHHADWSPMRDVATLPGGRRKTYYELYCHDQATHGETTSVYKHFLAVWRTNVFWLKVYNKPGPFFCMRHLSIFADRTGFHPPGQTRRPHSRPGSLAPPLRVPRLRGRPQGYRGDGGKCDRTQARAAIHDRCGGWGRGCGCTVSWKSRCDSKIAGD